MQEQPAKRRKVVAAAGEKREKVAMALDMSRFSKQEVELPGVDGISPAAPHSCRLAIAALHSGEASRYQAFFASGRAVYSVSAARPGASGEARGKEGAYIPQALPPGSAAAALIPQAAHRSEVQDLRLAEGGDGGVVLASVDSYGRAVLTHGRRDAGSPGEVVMGEAHCLAPPEVLCEAGWAGVAVAPGQASQAAVARHFPRDVTLFDGGQAVRTITTMHPPSALQLLSSSLGTGPGGGPLIAVAEGPQVSLWDVRGGGRQARVARLSTGPGGGHLMCIAASDDGGGTPLLGAAGEDRSVLVWDPRRWTAIGRWSNCLKYEATGLHFLSSDPARCVVAGLDYEALAGEWSGNRAARLGGGHRTSSSVRPDSEGAAAGDAGRGVSFRGDARWLGLAKAAGQDVVAAMTASSNLYIAEFC